MPDKILSEIKISSKNMEGIVTFLAAFVLCLISDVTGFRSFQHQIPNGNKVKHPCRPGAEWPTVGHAGPIHTPIKNLFGDDWKESGFNWKTVCPLDSDGDGMTNGEELGDPDCVWEFGMTPRYPEPKGHPGFCDQDRSVCSTDDRAIERSCRNIRFRRVPPKGRAQTRAPRQPPFNGMDHPQTRLTKWGRPTALMTPGASQPVFPGGPQGFPTPGMPRPGFQTQGMPRPGFADMSQSFPTPGLSQPVLPMQGAAQPGMSQPRFMPSPGLESMIGMSVYGTRPQPAGMFQSGMGSMFPSPTSGDSRLSFMGRTSQGIMGRSPTMFGGSGGMSSSRGVNGVVPRNTGSAGIQMRLPFRPVGFMGSSPTGMMGTEGRVSSMGGSPSMMGTIPGGMGF